MSITSATPARLDAALVDQLDAQVRAAVRRDGVDPQRDVHLVRSIAEQVVGRHDERSLTGAVVPVVDADGVVSELVARVSGFGALQPYLDDPEVEEIWINDPRIAPPQVSTLVRPLSPQRVRSAQDLEPRPPCGLTPAGSDPRPWARGASTCSA